MEERLGLDESLPAQYWSYLTNLVRGDWGDSWFTTRPVAEELTSRLPATLELITIAMAVIVIGGVLLGLLVSLRSTGVTDKLVALYGLLAGAFPDFWLGLVLSYVLFFQLGILPAPIGRMPTGVSTPEHVTGMFTVDALIAGDIEIFWGAAQQLILPVITLVLVYMGGVVKLSRSTIGEMLTSDMAQYARLCGLSERTVTWYALKNSIPPILTLIGMTYAFLLGGAVLVETVFSWGGVGQYVVESVGRADYFPVQAFVLIAALLNIAVYLAVDLIHVAIDPRVEY
jgi:peptide/nickel transport system permease protein